MALTIVAVRLNPAFLLVDTLATWRKDPSVALLFTLMYVLSPEKYVWLAIARGAAEGAGDGTTASRRQYSRLRDEGADDKGKCSAKLEQTAADDTLEAAIKLSAVDSPGERQEVKHTQFSLEAERLRKEHEAAVKTVEKIAGDLHTADLLGSRGAAILLFGGFLVLLDMAGLVALALALSPAHRAPAALNVGYCVTATGGVFVLMCALGYILVAQLARNGVSLPGPVAALQTQVRLLLLLAGVLRSEPSGGVVATPTHSAVTKPSADMLTAFWAKVQTSEEMVRLKTFLDWSGKSLDNDDCKVIAYLIAMGSMGKLTV